MDCIYFEGDGEGSNNLQKKTKKQNKGDRAKLLCPVRRGMKILFSFLECGQVLHTPNHHTYFI